MVATRQKKQRIAAQTQQTCIRGSLTIATCSLLCQSAHAQEFNNDWVLDTSYASYKEADDRISVNKLIGSVKGNISDTDRVSALLVVDSMSGATPTGGLASGAGLVSVSGTSGGGFSTGGQPQSLASFDDTRLAVDLEWGHDYTRTFRLNYGGGVSVENDYNSFGGSLELEKDDALKLTTYTAGIAFTSDRISQRAGDTPAPLSEVEDQKFFGEGERTTIDLILGLSRVLSARSVMQINMSFNDSQGYHSDPYKIVSIANSQDIELTRIYESRPASRRRSVLFGEVVHQLENGADLHISYRYYTDGWGISSHSVESRYRLKFKNDHYLEPHLRGYSQTAADFYVRTLPIGQAYPEFVSADNRLGKMQDYTVGVKYGIPLEDNSSVKFRLDYIKQTFDDAIIDSNEAILLQISFRKEFE